MKILALDLGATTGWAAVTDGKVVEYGQETFPGDRPERLYRFSRWLKDKTGWGAFNVVVFERPFSRGLYATRSLWGMAGVAEAMCYWQELPSLDIVPSTLKKWATGNGRASKEQMIVAAVALVSPAAMLKMGEHEADAIILGLYAAETIEPGE